MIRIAAVATMCPRHSIHAYLGRAWQRRVALTNAPNVLPLGDRILQFDDCLIEAPILLLHGAHLAQHLCARKERDEGSGGKKSAMEREKQGERRTKECGEGRGEE
jgi:hypothetical protein